MLLLVFLVVSLSLVLWLTSLLYAVFRLMVFCGGVLVGGLFSVSVVAY